MTPVQLSRTNGPKLPSVSGNGFAPPMPLTFITHSKLRPLLRLDASKIEKSRALSGHGSFVLVERSQLVMLVRQKLVTLCAAVPELICTATALIAEPAGRGVCGVPPVQQFVTKLAHGIAVPLVALAQ